MKTRNFKALAVAFSILIIIEVMVFWLGSKPPKHRVFINGQVLTMDEQSTVTEAVSVRQNRIEAAGSNAEINALIDDDTVVVDLAGRTLMPGFIDAHGHFPGSGFDVLAVDLNSPPIGPVSNMADINRLLAAKVKQTSPGKWVFGFGYDDTLLEEGVHPTRKQLDAISKDHPIAIMHVSGHMVVANTMAMELAGIDKNTPDPVGGVIVKGENGELHGLLEETAREGVIALAMDISVLGFMDMIRAAVVEYASVGVTTAQSGGADSSMAEGLKLAATMGLVPFRLEVWPFYNELGEQLLNGEFDAKEQSDEMYRVQTVKIVSDGSIQGYTGYLSHPYHAPFKGDKDYRGYPSIPAEELTEWVKRYHRAGIQLAIHANGDAAIDNVISAMEQAQQEFYREDPRLILIHSQMARRDQLQAMKRVGITPSFFSAHTYYWGDRHANIFMGPERASNMSPTAWALEEGLRFTVHLDTPVVPMNPMLLLWSTVNRQSTGGDIIGEHQRISVMQALRAITIDAAWQIFQEDKIGSLESGKYADMIILSASPLDNIDGIRDIQVEETIVGGKTIYRQ